TMRIEANKKRLPFGVDRAEGRTTKAGSSWQSCGPRLRFRRRAPSRGLPCCQEGFGTLPYGDQGRPGRFTKELKNQPPLTSETGVKPCNKTKTRPSFAACIAKPPMGTRTPYPAGRKTDTASLAQAILPECLASGRWRDATC